MALSNRTKRILNVLILAVILLFIMILVSQSVGLSGTGFDTPQILNQFYFYSAPGIGFILGVIIIFFVELLITKKDERFGDSILFNEIGEYPSLKFFKNINAFQLFWLSVIIFSILALVNFVGNKQMIFTGVGVLKEQFTPTTSVIFSSALIPASENLGLAFMLAFSLMLYRFFARKYDLSKSNFLILAYFIIPIMGGLYGVTNHILRYSGSDTSLFVVFMFWAIGGLITMLVGSFIPFWVMHIMNNLFFDLNTFLGSDVILTGAIITILVLIVGYVLFYYGMKKKKESEVM